MFLQQSTDATGIKMVSSVRVESSLRYHKLIFSNDEFEDECWFYRKDGRWRDAQMRLCGIPRIVKCIFEYPDSPTQDHIDLMEDVVRVIAAILDQSIETYKADIERSRKDQESFAREFFKDEEPNLDYLSKMAIAEASIRSSGYLYLMRHANGLTKIGRSVQPKAREKTLQAEDPRLEMIFCVDGVGYLEGRLHEIFADLRVRGEWFRLEESHVDWIKFLIGKSAQ